MPPSVWVPDFPTCWLSLLQPLLARLVVRGVREGAGPAVGLPPEGSHSACPGSQGRCSCRFEILTFEQEPLHFHFAQGSTRSSQPRVWLWSGGEDRGQSRSSPEGKRGKRVPVPSTPRLEEGLFPRLGSGLWLQSLLSLKAISTVRSGYDFPPCFSSYTPQPPIPRQLLNQEGPVRLEKIPEARRPGRPMENACKGLFSGVEICKQFR